MVDAIAGVFLLGFGWFVGWVQRGIVEKRRRRAYAAAELEAEMEAVGAPCTESDMQRARTWIEEYRRGHVHIGRAQWD